MPGQPSDSPRSRSACRGLSRTCLLVGFFWGVAEGTCFFLVPDILITFAALFSLRHSLRLVGAVMAGCLLAGILMFQFGRWDSGSAEASVVRVPFVYAEMFATCRSAFDASPTWTLCRAPFSGIPYKVYAVVAPDHISLAPFLVVSLSARCVRFLVGWALFGIPAWFVRRRTRRFRTVAPVIHVAGWIALYVVYWATTVQRFSDAA